MTILKPVSSYRPTVAAEQKTDQNTLDSFNIRCRLGCLALQDDDTIQSGSLLKCKNETSSNVLPGLIGLVRSQLKFR